MKHPVLAVTVAFFLGIGVGSIAIGNKGVSPGDTNVAFSGDDTSPPTLGILEAKSNKPNGRDPLQGTELHPAEGLDNKPVTVELGPMTEHEQIQLIFSKLGEVVNTVSRMRQRVGDLEQKLAKMKPQRAPEQRAETNTLQRCSRSARPRVNVLRSSLPGYLKQTRKR